jgi:alpha-aminoadipic semialdehyde synthase
MKGRVVEIEGNGGIIDDLYPVDFMPGFNLVGYANRDSIKYADIYGVEKECSTLIRGTLRYQVGYFSSFYNIVKWINRLTHIFK